MKRRMGSLFLALLLSLPTLLPIQQARVQSQKWQLNVKVGGDTLVRGGGLHSFYIVGSTHGEVEVIKPSGDVSVALDDQSEIDHIVTYSNTTLTSTTATDAKAAVSPQIAKEPEVKVSVKKGNGQLDPKSIQPLVTNKKVTAAGSNSETSIERMIILVKLFKSHKGPSQ
ncbi:hypothetical protein EBB07_05300 [Paenibacillaceae bacterium]|nr:hypothetical protein EBB07_05300 [Paenibacillaceae bacterium]